MKITGRQLRQVIREELSRALFEADQSGDIPYSLAALRAAPVGSKIVVTTQTGPFEFVEKKSGDLFQGTDQTISTSQVIGTLSSAAKAKYTPEFLGSQTGEFTVKFSEQDPKQQRYSTGDVTFYPAGAGQFTMIDAIAGETAYSGIDRVMKNIMNDGLGTSIVIKTP